jgi:hypothetical protein
MQARGIPWLSVALILLFSPLIGAAQSLGDLARAQKDKQNQSAKKTSKVYTSDDFPPGNAPPAAAAPAVVPQPAHPAVSATKRQPSVPTITAETSDGQSVQLGPDNGTDLIFMATWCPHSTALKNIINDPRTRPYWANKKLVFLFSKNEWGRVESYLKDMAKSGRISEDQIPAKLEQLKSKAGSPYVTDPAFLNDLPGDYYFCYRPKEVTGYPTALSVLGYIDRLNWLIRDLKMPRELAQQLVDQYDPATQNVSDK